MKYIGEKSKQGRVVALSFPEDYETHIRDRVFDKIFRGFEN